MDRKSVEQFRKTLEAQQAELLRSASQAQQEGRSLDPSASKDEGDRAIISQTKEMLLHQKTHNTVLVNAVRAALGRIEAGTFGLCINCEQEINMNRLNAIPWAQYCISCQELIEGQR